ncbi:MAG TPA: tRNA (adenosine(37)-N6)-dimethylallyltransferase MiaA [Gaiellaceae bacterium]|nr:tRNA (adenosine(37)-N6)-dimethylallyltransferase MiaA [Gaiellaceae bacterium]
MSDSRVDLPVIAIFGATATGKSAVASAIFERISAELVSADSMQAYRGLPILTNQPEEPTRLVGIWELDHEASVGEYAALAHEVIDRARAGTQVPVVVGGTGLYFRAALSELELPPAPVPGARERIESLYERLGPEGAHAELRGRDPRAALAVHANDRKRVVRALELAESGRSLAPVANKLWSEDVRHPTVVFGLDLPKDLLGERIVQRAHRMFDRGVEEEVRRALAGAISATARQVIGLHEVAELPRREAIAALVARTARYAAYQRKWMRRIPGIVSLSADRPPGEIADEILEVARTRQRLPAHRAG